MGKAKRLSIPISPALERQLRQMSAENGRSLASNFAEMAMRGAEKATLEQQLSTMKNQLSGGVNAVEILTEMRNEFAKLKAEFSNQETTGVSSAGVLLTNLEAQLLFEQVFFSAFLAQEMAAAEMPGAERKPGGFHIARAREKAQMALKSFLARRAEA